MYSMSFIVQLIKLLSLYTLSFIVGFGVLLLLEYAGLDLDVYYNFDPNQFDTDTYIVLGFLSIGITLFVILPAVGLCFLNFLTLILKKKTYLRY